MLRTFAAIVMSVTTAAAAPAAPVTKHGPIVENVYVDAAFTKDETAAIVEACDAWNASIGSSILYKFAGRVAHSEAEPKVSGNNVYVVKVAPDPIEILDRLNGGTYTVAYVDDIPGHVVHVIDWGEPTPGLSAVVMHEIGHIEGLVHLPVKSALMYPIGPGKECVDTTTLLELAVLRPELDRAAWKVTCDEPVDGPPAQRLPLR